MNAAAPETHRVGRIAFHPRVRDLDAAMALRPRLEDFAWRALPAAVARVCEKLPLDGRHLTIARLDLDLGRVGPDRLEDDGIAAFETALSEALIAALHRATHAPDATARLLSSGGALAERFGRYLASGTAPYRAGAAGFDPRAAFRALAADDPDTLVALLRRQAGRRTALERLVLQLEVDDLAALLRLLAPADAAIILALMMDVVLAHRLSPLREAVPVGEPALRRLLWVATLEFLLRDAGSQFNRRRFLDFLLRREAARLGIDYRALLELLGEALESARVREGFRSSLPVVLANLLGESDRKEPAPPASRQPEPRGMDAALEAARTGDFVPLADWARAQAGERWRLDTLTARLDRPLFAGLVRTLEPQHGGAIVAVVDDVVLLNRQEPLLVEDGLERMLRALTLAYLLHDGGSGFNRRRYVAYLIEREAARAGLRYEILLRLMAEAAQRMRARAGLGPALPGLLDQLVGELPDDRPAREDAPDAAESALVAARQGDVVPLLDLLRAMRRTPARFTMLARKIEPAMFARMVARLKPSSAAAILGDLAALRDLHRGAALAPLSEAAFARVLQRLALGDLLDDTRARFQRRGFVRRLIAALAAETGQPVATLRAAIARRLAASSEPERAPFAAELAAEPAQSQPDDPPHAAPGPVTDAVSGELAALVRLHRSHPLAALSPEAFDALLTALAAEHLRTHGHRPFDSSAFSRALIEGIARHEDETPEAVRARMLDGAETIESHHAEAQTRTRSGQRAIEQYLTRGEPETIGNALPELAREQPAWLATLIRRLARSRPGAIDLLLDRLLAWLLPEEVADLLGGEAMVPGPGGAQRNVLAALLQGKRAPPQDANSDSLAALKDWIEYGHWDGAGDPAAALPSLSTAELTWLLLDRDAARTLQRVRFLASAVPDDALRALIARLAPWALNARGPLKSLFASLPEDRHIDLTLRATAGALHGAPIDLSALAREEPPSAVPRTPTAPRSEPDREALLAWLDGAEARESREFANALGRPDGTLRARIAAGLADRATQARWAEALPADALAAIVAHAAPAEAGRYREAVIVLGTAWRQVAPFGAHRPDDRELWAIVLAMLADGRPPSLAEVMAKLTAHLTGGSADARAALDARATQLAGTRGHPAIAALVRRATPAKPDPKEAKIPPARDEPEEQDGQATEEPADTLYIGNAGLVLLAPYLPALFDRLGVLTTDDEGKTRIAGEEAASRAVHLLQYCADSRLDAPEPELVLNKLLCGLPIGQPVLRAIEAHDEDRAMCDGLLEAVIANWTILGHTSIAGLRETFLQREGRLTRSDNGWALRVQRRALDVLVDQMPWSFAMICHRWMPDAVQVTW